MQNYEQQQNPLNLIPEGSEAYIRGKVDYCRIAKQIDGDALTRDMASRRQRGRDPIERPYTTLTLKDPTIVPISKDLNNMTALETLLHNTRFYSSAKDASKRFTSDNKGNSIPKAAHWEDGKYHAVILQNELAQDSDVMIKVRVFKPKTRRNHGLAMDAVMIMDPVIKYWAPSGDIASSMAAAGMGEWVEMSPEEEARQRALAAEHIAKNAAHSIPQCPQTNYQENAYQAPSYGQPQFGNTQPYPQQAYGQPPYGQGPHNPYPNTNQNQGFINTPQELTQYPDPESPSGNGISMPV